MAMPRRIAAASRVAHLSAEQVVEVAVADAQDEGLDLGRRVDQAGPSGSREFRTATPPSGSAAHSTQLPLGLLRPLFCHVTPCNWPAGMPLTMRLIRSSLLSSPVGCRPAVFVPLGLMLEI